MELNLPNKMNSQNPIIVTNNTFVIVGANGSGKTRFGENIEKKYNSIAHRIAAQKSLNMPDAVSPKAKDIAEKEFYYGGYNYGSDENWHINHGKNMYRWGRNPATFLLDDFGKLLVLLHTEEYEISVKFKDEFVPNTSQLKPITKLDKIQKIWEDLMPHRKLKKLAGKIETFPPNNPTNNYNTSKMSDGERVMFYLIGEVLCAKEGSIIIIDEPELHLHRSILKKLWDRIENERQDCVFIYLTHDVDFAFSRMSATKIWLKSFDGDNSWEYEIISSNNGIDEQLYMEILGSRLNILFIEGLISSIDYLLYQQLFPEYTIKALGSCGKVFEATKSFNEHSGLHSLRAKGIVDRDRRSDAEIDNLKLKQIYAPRVAEIENYFLLENVIKTVAKRMLKDENEIFNSFKTELITLFQTDLEEQAVLYTKHRIRKDIEFNLDPTGKTFDKFKNSFDSYFLTLNIQQIFDNCKNKFREYINNQDYEAILMVYNNKGIMYKLGLPKKCGITNRNGDYINFVLNLIKQNEADGQLIKQAIKEKIEIN
jgi:ABC-type cobalamin/Fe3+-siderophores transport system ATPase subunit